MPNTEKWVPGFTTEELMFVFKVFLERCSKGRLAEIFLLEALITYSENIEAIPEEFNEFQLLSEITIRDFKEIIPEFKQAVSLICTDPSNGSSVN